MNIKDIIKGKALELFNAKGVMNVTLREVAKELNKSYGNITYHYRTKNCLITALYNDMMIETKTIAISFSNSNLFYEILDAPKKTFKISMKYLFFYVDYIEIKRNFSTVFINFEKNNDIRKVFYKSILEQLQDQGIIRAELNTKDLDYLMELSGAIRTFFFLNLSSEKFLDKELENQYVEYVNRLLIPYLTSNGLEQYNTYKTD
ncbi:TetR/AcrR family transcriptional regulator [Aquimarina spinulae]|uniref:TetR/AcrR family transcriptional regulator n=1 Tax=Aquimarina spinulae TaxID=1192023 RepID=UPI000D54D694|nr:TetR/AcrR family transcriptional regulator [Aquimarina spinulae]